MKKQQIKHTVIMKQYDRTAIKAEKDSRRDTLNHVVCVMTSHLQASSFLCSSYGYNVTVLHGDSNCPLTSTDVVGWQFVFSVNSMLADPTRQLFESLFHYDSMIDQYMDYSCELVDG